MVDLSYLWQWCFFILLFSLLCVYYDESQEWKGESLDGFFSLKEMSSLEFVFLPYGLALYINNRVLGFYG